MQRALALRCLEIPVGDFISDAMKGDLPDIEGCKELLESNVKDEINHDIALDLQLRHIRSPLGLRQKLSALRRRGSNLTATLSSRLLSSNAACSLYSSRSFDSLEIRDYEPLQRTSPEMSKPTSRLTPSSAKSLVLSLTKSSISLVALRLLGCFNPSKGKTH